MSNGAEAVGNAPLVFGDVVVTPYAELLDSPSGLSDARGGPIWPEWDRQVEARHCRGGRPCDRLPGSTGQPAATVARATWIGPIVRHYGHQVADFSMRILPSLLVDPDAKLLFATKPTLGIASLQEAPAFFHEILRWFGATIQQCELVAEPVVVTRLDVHAQAEQLLGPGPGEGVLDALDHLTLSRLGDDRKAQQKVALVTRGGVRGRPVGGFAGEAYLERVARASGVEVIQPGPDTSLLAELKAYHSTDQLVFLEGSALHSLQLAGRLSADITVFSRGHGHHIAEANIAPRARSLNYVDATVGMVHGLRPSGEAAKPTGIAILDDERLLRALQDVGFAVASRWSTREFTSCRDEDVREWLRGFKAAGRSEVPGSRDEALRTLTDCGLPSLLPYARRVLA